MIYELRVYDCFAGKLPDLHDRFANHTMKLFEKHGIKNVGYWVTDVGPSNQSLTYLVAFADANQRAEAWNSFRADPEWLEKRAETEKDGQIEAKVVNYMLQPTSCSSVK